MWTETVCFRVAQEAVTNVVRHARAQTERSVGIELQRARLEAEAADRAKDHFLATLSQELRTPLNAISGWAYLMRNSPKDENAGGARTRRPPTKY